MKEERGSVERDRGRERERSRRGDRPSRFSSNTRDRSPVRERKKATGDKRVYVSNVAYESKWQDIKDLFRSQVGEVTYVALFTDENDKPRGCGIVEFESSELAAKAVEKMHRYDLKGRKLVVKEDSDVERDKHGRPVRNRERDQNNSNSSSRRDDPPRSNTWEGNNQQPSMNSNTSSAAATAGASSSGNNNSKNWGNTYGLSPQFLESLWIQGPLVSKVFVANLDYKVDEKKFKEVFRLAGRVIDCEISMDKDGKSRGFGVVEYEHPVEAVQAISMLHNQLLFDRRLTVRMDRVEGPPKLPEGLKNIGMGLGANGQVLTDVARNFAPVNSPPLVGLTSNVQQLQAVAAAQAQAQLAQVGQPSLNAVGQGPLGISNLASTNALATNMNVSGLLGHVNMSDLAHLHPNQQFGGPPSQTLTSSLSAGLNSGLNTGLGSGLGVGGNSGIGQGFNPMSAQSSLMGGNSNAFGNSGNNLSSTGAGFNAPRDFDAMSAALSSGFSYDRDNFRGASSNSGANFNGSSRSLGNGRGNITNNVPSNSGRQGGVIIVKNLPPNTTWAHLKDKFREVGDVTFTEIQPNNTGLVKFSSEYEAERAVRELDRTRFEGRTIDVMLY